MSFLGFDIEENRQYAVNKNIPYILVFKGNEIKLINVSDSSEKTVSITDLLAEEESK